jgi:hypothetical protein
MQHAARIATKDSSHFLSMIQIFNDYTLKKTFQLVRAKVGHPH